MSWSLQPQTEEEEVKKRGLEKEGDLEFVIRVIDRIDEVARHSEEDVQQTWKLSMIQD